jgi:hypothetical protein
MNVRILGILALMGAPFLFIDTMHNNFSITHTSPYSGFFNLLYITGWMCSITALNKIGALGKGVIAKLVFSIQMFLLVMANAWNVYEWIQPNAGTGLYFFLDVFWPISNFFMLVTGITIACVGTLHGWRRFIPLIVGCWLPLGILLWVLFTRTPGVLLTLSVYSAVCWSLMALSIITSPTDTSNNFRDHIIQRRKSTAAY